MRARQWVAGLAAAGLAAAGATVVRSAMPTDGPAVATVSVDAAANRADLDRFGTGSAGDKGRADPSWQPSPDGPTTRVSGRTGLLVDTWWYQYGLPGR
ncbi:MAG: hypothetical protein V7637_2787 [Mycobacteriales bacterium]